MWLKGWCVCFFLLQRWCLFCDPQNMYILGVCGVVVAGMKLPMKHLPFGKYRSGWQIKLCHKVCSIGHLPLGT